MLEIIFITVFESINDCFRYGSLETEINIIKFTRFLDWKQLQILEAYLNFFGLRFWLMSFCWDEIYGKCRWHEMFKNIVSDEFGTAGRAVNAKSSTKSLGKSYHIISRLSWKILRTKWIVLFVVKILMKVESVVWKKRYRDTEKSQHHSRRRWSY